MLFLQMVDLGLMFVVKIVNVLQVLLILSCLDLLQILDICLELNVLNDQFSLVSTMTSGIFMDLDWCLSDVHLQLISLSFWVLNQVFVDSDILLHVVDDFNLLVESDNCCFEMFDLNFLLREASYQFFVQNNVLWTILLLMLLRLVHVLGLWLLKLLGRSLTEACFGSSGWHILNEIK